MVRREILMAEPCALNCPTLAKGIKKAPDLAVRGRGTGRPWGQPRACSDLLGRGSAGSGGGSSVSSSLGSVSGRSSSVSSS